MFPAEKKLFTDKFGYEPLEIKVATGSVGSLGKTATTVILVDKDNPIDCLSIPQLDAVYSKSRKNGYKEVNTWGDLGAGGVGEAGEGAEPVLDGVVGSGGAGCDREGSAWGVGVVGGARPG